MSSVKVVIGPETVRSYKRLSYETWWALAEFIDNSSQSYFNNRALLDTQFEKGGRNFEVLINYSAPQDLIRISDNAMGMSLEELQRAVMIGNPPADRTGRHEFGMGLKTAACWLGNSWKITTTKYGDPNEYEITFDVEKVASGDFDLDVRTIAVDKSLHYTVLEVSAMHQKIQGRLLGRLKENLRSIYRIDTRNGDMTLRWGDEELNYDSAIEFYTAADGTPYRKEFDFLVNGKRVYGWAGIIGGVGGRPKAGFAIARRRRLIKGQPDAWRPQSIFGQLEGTNDLVNQRILGEIHLDDFEVSHTKNQILWQGDELDLVEEELKLVFNDYKHVAQNLRKRGGGPSGVAQATALDEIQGIITSGDFVDLVNLTEVPPPELVDEAFKPLVETMRTVDADKTYVLGDLTIKLFMDTSRSASDPYFHGDYVGGSTVSVCINTNHRFWQDYVQDAQDMMIYTLNCIYDSLAEWKCMQKTGEIRPDTVKLMKDSYMRYSIADS